VSNSRILVCSLIIVLAARRVRVATAAATSARNRLLQKGRCPPGFDP
jgi:hypothetical protein